MPWASSHVLVVLLYTRDDDVCGGAYAEIIARNSQNANDQPANTTDEDCAARPRPNKCRKRLGVIMAN